MKKIMYLIFNVSHGKGGHFYSLQTTAEALTDSVCRSIIVNIGIKSSPVIENCNIENYFIYFNGYNFFSVFNQLDQIVQQFKPDIIHSFDIPVHLFARMLRFKYQLPLVLTKCGGANLKYTPYADTFILYSEENFTYLEKQKKFKNTQFYTIPNRVNEVQVDNLRIKDLIEKYRIDTSKKIFLRISRFTSAYEESMIQAVNLVVYMQKRNLEVQLIILGEIQEQKSFDLVKNYTEEMRDIFLITDSAFTLNASELIEVADCVIGTGRGLIEAASRGKVLFTPILHSDVPAFVDKVNARDFIKTNFSPRNEMSRMKAHSSLDDSIKVIDDFSEKKKYEAFARHLFDEYYNIRSCLAKYATIYNSRCYHRENKPFDLLMHFFYVLRLFIIAKKKFR